MNPDPPKSKLIRVGQVLMDRYRLERHLGSGGSGTVFVATDLQTGDEVAAKVIHRRHLRDEVTMARVLRELKAMEALSHPHLVPLLDTGWSGQVPVLIMPLLTGPTLWQYLQREGPLEFVDLPDLFSPLCSALATVHRGGFLHRDIKSANVLLDEERGPQLLDMGLAVEDGEERLTAPGYAAGTPEYMAPERIMGEPEPDHRSDLYALGVVMFEAVTGRLPDLGPSRVAILRNQVRGAVPDPREARVDLPEPLREIIRQCLAKNPEARPPTALDLARRIEDALAQLGVRESGSRALQELDRRVVLLVSDDGSWERMSPQFSIFRVEPLRASSLAEVAALMDANPRSVLWSTEPSEFFELVDLLSGRRVLPPACVMPDLESARALERAGMVAAHVDPKGSTLEFLRVARAVFGPSG